MALNSSLFPLSSSSKPRLSRTQKEKTTFHLPHLTDPQNRGPPSTSKSHHIDFHPVLQERPSSPLSPNPAGTSSLRHSNNIIPVPHGWLPFMRNIAGKLVHVDNSRTPSLAINSVASNCELHPQRWLQSRLAATSSTTPATGRKCNPVAAVEGPFFSFLPVLQVLLEFQIRSDFFP
ncbi:hypothetical protein BDE02_01G196500 [Populus trichocarpa]|nr:hypothetical protein BDE02_01G196500 [Populus trichocarpa]